MNYLEKINKVRENIQEWQKEHGKEFSYQLMGIGIGEDPIDDWTYLVTPEEEKEIIKYLERRGFLEILEEKEKSVKIKTLPKKDPTIKLKTLELMSRELKDHYTGYEITKLLEGCGADKKLIVANSKWLIFYGLFEELALGQDEKAKKLLFKIIGEAVHPLNLGGDKEKSDKLIEKFNEYLEYDNLAIFSGDKGQYTIDSTKNLIEVDKEDLTQDFSLAQEILPDINKGTFSEKVLELVADEFAKHLPNFEIRNIITPLLLKNTFLKDEPAISEYVDDWFDEKPWKDNLKTVLNAIRKKDEEPDKHIAEIIEALLHPLNHKADEDKTEEIADKIGKYLRYDNFYIRNTGKEYTVFSESEMDEMHSSSPEFEEQEKQNKKDDEEKIKQSKETIKALRDTHQSYLDILEIFCRDTKKPTKELNDAYIFLSNKIEKTIKELGIKTYPYQIFFYKPFKNNLYSAESEWNSLGAIDRARRGYRLSWDGIRPPLYKVHSDIIKLLNMAEEDIVMTDEEKKLEDITKLISEKRTAKPTVKEVPPPLQIEISKMPDLNVRNLEENTLQKGKKRIRLPKFKPTDWSKISIRFIDDRNVLITADKKDVVQSDYEALGFADEKKDKPNMAWAFFRGLAMNNGETKELPNPIPDKIKQQKKQLSDRLKTIFKNDTDPFYEPTETRTYKIKVALIPPTSEEKSDKYGTKEYLDETMTEEYEN